MAPGSAARTLRRRAVAAVVGALTVGVAVSALLGEIGLAVAGLGLLVGGALLVALDARTRLGDLAHMARLAAGRQTQLRDLVARGAGQGNLGKTVALVGERVEASERRLLAGLEAERLRAADRHSEVMRDGEARIDGLHLQLDESVRNALGGSGRRIVNELSAVAREQTRDVEALLQLYPGITPRAAMPLSGDWALNGASLLHLADLVRRKRPRLVLELGGGTSTVWLGYLLEGTGAQIVSLDHDPDYANLTRESVARHGLESAVEIRTAPLEDVVLDDESWRWYASSAWSDLKGVDLLLVDGPPKRTGQYARYPAIPQLIGALAPDAWVLLDDTHRPDEQEIVRRWRQGWPGLTEAERGVSRLGVLQRQS